MKTHKAIEMASKWVTLDSEVELLLAHSREGRPSSMRNNKSLHELTGLSCSINLEVLLDCASGLCSSRTFERQYMGVCTITDNDSPLRHSVVLMDEILESGRAQYDGNLYCLKAMNRTVTEV